MRRVDLIAATPHVDWLLLTKRIHLVRKQLPQAYELPYNVWLGAPVENQDAASKRLNYLLEFDTQGGGTGPLVQFIFPGRSAQNPPQLEAVDAQHGPDGKRLPTQRLMRASGNRGDKSHHHRPWHNWFIRSMKNSLRVLLCSGARPKVY